MSPRSGSARALVATVVALAVAPAAAGAAVPSIVNQSAGCSGQTTWLISCATTGENGAQSGGHIIRLSTLVSQDAANTIPTITTNQQWASSTTDRAVTCDTKPNIFGGYPRSRCDLSFSLNTSGTGISGGNLGLGCNIGGSASRTGSGTLSIQAKDSAGQVSASTASTVKFTSAGHAANCTDPAYLYEWPGLTSSTSLSSCTSPTGNNFNNNTTPGSTLRFCYNGDSPGGGEAFNGVKWHLRNIRTGTITGGGTSCAGNGDNNRKVLPVTFPDRGAWVVEGELLRSTSNGTDCGNDGNTGYWFPIGAADVNSTTAPTFTLAASRPQYGGNTTVSASAFSDPDADNGGGAQILEWDLDGNTTNGVSGFEATTIAGAGSTISTTQSKTHGTSGETPGLHSVRVKVTDNGAMDAADSDRTTRTVTTSYLVDTAPVGGTPATSTYLGDPVDVTLTGTDIDGDTLTYLGNGTATHGTVTGSGPTRTYTPDPGYLGSDSFTYTVDDGYGRQGTGTATVTVLPDTTITSAPSGTVQSDTADFTFGGGAVDSTYQCSLDGGPYSTCATHLQGLEDGDHTLDVRADDGDGHIDQTPAEATWTVDTLPGVTTFDSGPDALTNDDTATFTFHANKRTVTFECRLDGGSFQPCDSGIEVDGLSDGTHNFRVRSIDSFGRVEPTPQLWTWVVDTTHPHTALSGGPTGDTSDTSATFDFTSKAGATFQCSLDGEAFDDCDSGISYTDLPDGPHTFRVQATDTAGNTELTPQSRAWTVDTLAPVVTIDQDPAGPADRAQAEFSTADASATLECVLDGDTADDSAWGPCFSPLALDDLAEGDHTLSVRAVDPAGNVSDIEESTWTVDTTPPQTTIVSGPDTLTQDNSAIFDATTDEGQLQCKLDATAWADCPDDMTFDLLADGAHVMRIRSVDDAGNVDPTPATWAWTVDTTAPGVQVRTAPALLTNKTRAVFELASEDGATLECRVAHGAADGSWGDCGSPFAFSAPDDNTDGDYTLHVRATDAAGNTGGESTYTWTIDTAAPDTEATSGPSDVVSSTAADIAFDSPEDNARFECRLDLSDWNPCTSPTHLAGLADGDHAFEIRAIDRAGNPDDTPALVEWTVDAAAPATTITSGPSGLNSSRSAKLEFAASRDGSTFQCRLDDATSWTTCASPYSLSGLGDGAHTLAVRAVDGNGTDPSPAQRSWTVDATPPETKVVSGPASGKQSTDATLQLDSDDADTFQCSLDGADWIGCPATVSFSGLSAGNHTVFARAVDAAGNVDPSPANWVWSIAAPPGSTTTTTPSTTVTVPSKTCTVKSTGTPCKAPAVAARLLRGANHKQTDLSLTAATGGVTLKQVAWTLPIGTTFVWTSAARGTTIGALQLLGAGAKKLGTLALDLPKSAKGKVLIKGKNGLTVTLERGAKPAVRLAGLPAGVTAVSLRLYGERTRSVLAPLSCTGLPATVDLLDATGAKATLTAHAGTLCRAARRTR